MNSIKAILLSIILSTSLYSAEVNYWNQDDDLPYFYQRDNQSHILFFGVVSATVSYYAIKEFGFTKTEAWLFGVGVSLFIGAGKELSDTKFDWNDYSSDALGGIIGSSIIVITF